jgi:phosphoribosylformimino-5-aminoimidazole carboxamide ribotide isomerase
MEIIPAIDIKDNLCVRLYKGDFDQSTIYGEDPIAVAQRWADEGATRLHIVDLDGAREGRPINTDIIRAMVRAVNIPIQLGGGLRNEEDIAATLDMGVSRVILGTAAVDSPRMVERLVRRFGSSIAIGVDARNGFVATEGWILDTHMPATDLINDMARIGVQRIIYTDINRDGTLTEPNFAATAALVRTGGPAIIASGGISHCDHLHRMARVGVEGVIIGKALYTDTINLPRALATLREIGSYVSNL